MSWVKALHVAFMVTWFAGLFYLPRLFVYHADCPDEPGRRRFALMERRLYTLMSIGAVLTVVSGAWLAASYGAAFWRDAGWLHAKLVLVGLLLAFHLHCRVSMRALAAGTDRRSARWYRWYNEIPGVLLLAIVALAVVKPF